MAITCFRPSKANSDTSSSSCRGAWGDVWELLSSQPLESGPPWPQYLPPGPLESQFHPVYPLPLGPALAALAESAPACGLHGDGGTPPGRSEAEPLTSCFSKNGRMSSRAWWPMVECSCSKVFAAASLTSSSGSHKAFLAVGTRDSEKYSTCNGMRALNLMWWRERKSAGVGAMRTSGLDRLPGLLPDLDFSLSWFLWKCTSMRKQRGSVICP